MATKKEDLVTIKTRSETRKLLRLIAAVNDEQLLDVLQRLAVFEWNRLVESGVVPSSLDAKEK